VSELQKTLPEKGTILGEHLFWLARPTLDSSYAARTLVESPWPGRTAAEWITWIDPDIVLWPGPVYGKIKNYVLSNHYQLYEMPQCSRFLMIWLRPGVEMEPSDP
jgi:hypothetical protein